MWGIVLSREKYCIGEGLMIRKSAFILIVVAVLIFSGCPEISDIQFDYDPDPVDDSVVLPNPAEDLYIAANIGGTIYGFDSNDPQSYTILATDASTGEYFSEIRISQSLEYLLYARDNGVQTDLVIFNIPTAEITVIATDITSNESEFINNDNIQYSHGGEIIRFNITAGTSIILVEDSVYNCNHGGQVSPDGNKLVFKNQDPSQHEFATIAWSDNIPANSCNSIVNYSGTIYLAESFYFNWRDDNRVILKTNPGLSYRLSQQTLDTGVMLSPAVISSGGEDIYFEKIIISPDKKNLLIYGHNSLDMLDLLTTIDITGTIEPVEIYSSSFITKYAAFGSSSESFVVGTDNWMGIYNTEGLQKTNASIENILGDYGSLYALHCR